MTIATIESIVSGLAQHELATCAATAAAVAAATVEARTRLSRRRERVEGDREG